MIKKIEIADLSVIAEYEKNFIHNDSYNHKTLLSMFQNKNYLLYGYFQEETLIAYLIASLNGSDVELLKIFTSELFRNKQVASKLINYLIVQYPNSIYTEVNAKNKVAIEFYLKNNFKKLSVRKNYYGNGEDANVLVRKI
jgi:ribosomal-protein-alanine N-acetyltransferase